jgi:hypothetical protein
MDLFSMQLFNHKLFRAKTQSSKLILYISSTVITAYLMSATNTVDSEEQVEIDESLPEALDTLLKKHAKHKGFNTKTPVYILMDDYFLNMQRITLNDIQLKTLHQVIDIEIDNINDFLWDVEIAEQEVKGKHTALVFLLKKEIANEIELTIKKHELTVKSISPRYLATKTLIKKEQFKIEHQQVNALIDISDTRARLFFILNNKIKLYRRITFKKIEQKKKGDLEPIKEAFNAILPLYRTAKDQYISRYTNQDIHKIYMTSDIQDIKKIDIKIDTKTVMQIEDHIDQKNIKYPDRFRYVYGYINAIQDKQKFNIIPYQERLEMKIIKKIGLTAGVILFCICLWAGGNALELKKEFKRYNIKTTKTVSDQIKIKKAQMTEREHLKNKKALLDYIDVMKKINRNQVKINDILFLITTITPPDIELKNLTISGDKIKLTGTASALNRNYTFYHFLDQLEQISYLSNPRYFLAEKSQTKSSFTINLNWIKHE